MRRKKNLTLSLAELAGILKGRASGDGAADILIQGLCTLEEASPSDLAIVGSEKYAAGVSDSKAGAFLTTEQTRIAGRPCLVVEHVWLSALEIFDLFYPDEPAPAGVHPSAVVDGSARLGNGVSVGPLAVIEAGAEIGDRAEIGAQCFVGRDARIGEGSLLHPGVRVLERVQVGRHVILHSGVVLGADGFSYEIIGGRGVKIPQVGTVVIEDEVEIGANTCIDRAFLTETRIGAGTKIDNLVQIAHNCRIGRSCGFAAQVGIAGSTIVGDGCIFWGQVGVRDHLKIGNRVVLMGQSGPGEDIPDGEHWMGSPARPISEIGRVFAAEKRLPEMLKRLKALEKKVL